MGKKYVHVYAGWMASDLDKLVHQMKGLTPPSRTAAVYLESVYIKARMIQTDVDALCKILKNHTYLVSDEESNVYSYLDATRSFTHETRNNLGVSP